MHKCVHTEKYGKMHCENPDVALKTVRKLSVELWTLLALNGRHLGYVAEGEGPLFKLEMAAGYVVTTVNIATLYKRVFSTKHHYTVVRYKPSVSFLG